MSLSFSNIHIRKTEGVQLSDVEKLLCGEYEKKGFEQIDNLAVADEKVVLCDVDGSGWITVCSGLLDKRLLMLSKALNTDVMQIDCWYSDFVEMNLVTPDGTDARAIIGRPYYGEHENLYSQWEGKVSDLSKFIEIASGDNVSTDDALAHLDELMGLPTVQSCLFAEIPPQNGDGVTVKTLGFSLAGEPEDVPPRLNIYHQNGMPAIPKVEESFCIRNLGGASKGLGIVIFGDYIKKNEINFVNCMLNIGWKSFCVEFEKIERDDGSYVLTWQNEDIDIPPVPSKKLSHAKREKLEFERRFTFSYTPFGNNRKFLDIRICVAPLKNWIGGQDDTYVWKLYGSKRKFIERHNERCRRRTEYGTFPKDPVGIIREEDYDLD